MISFCLCVLAICVQIESVQLQTFLISAQNQILLYNPNLKENSEKVLEVLVYCVYQLVVLPNTLLRILISLNILSNVDLKKHT